MQWLTLRNIIIVFIVAVVIKEAISMTQEIGLRRSLPTLLVVLVVFGAIYVLIRKLKEKN